ncbi:MAG: hypothetical protein KKF46_01975 [Nanoarchaeota archaeon]|nr:hypothetical protein [Nanoarchaeota archaeon]MBU1321101.1 hypothetical protein [Nanoarchaeota archaeon]MBU1597310.1 hypothetical protein [Nanoarchaeota archaeon]MBU2441149.1 hypothetical protein [Nanoarchaeota archaeon]
MLTLIKPELIAFNTDYAWNVYKRGNWQIRDWNSHNRLIKILEENDMIKSKKKIFYDNASEFFRID